MDPGALPPLGPPAERPPVYKRAWFWGAIGVVALTTLIIVVSVSSQGPSTPDTDLGNKRAF